MGHLWSISRLLNVNKWCKKLPQMDTNLGSFGTFRVTRFGKIQPLWQNFKCLGQYFDG